MNRMFGGFGAITFLLVAGCMPSKPQLADEVMASRWANDPRSCGTSYITLNDGEMRLHENGKSRKSATSISIKDLPDIADSVALELTYPNEPEGKNKAMIILQLQNNILVPRGLASQTDGYALVTKTDDPFIKAFTLHRCA